MADADRILHELIDQIVKDKRWEDPQIEIKAITSGGANYTSALYLVNLSLKHGNTVKLFAKVAIIAEKLREIMGANRLFYLEAFYYNSLSITYDNLQKKHGLINEHKFIYPKFFGCITKKLEETVVLENLVASGYGSYNRMKSLDWDHAAAAVEALARFHALSFAFQKEQPEEFKAVCEDIKYVMSNEMEAMKPMWKKMGEKTLLIVKEKHREQLNKYLQQDGVAMFLKYRYPLGTTVIAHGDYRVSNMLFKRQDDKVHAIPVDYQTIHTGSPPSDLVYFELMGTDSEFRDKYHNRLVDHYYTELCEALQRLDVDPTEVYPREVFDKELEETLPYSVALGICLLPLVLVEAEQAPRVDENLDVESFMVESSDLYPDRFAGIVEDCVRWGVI